MARSHRGPAKVRIGHLLHDALNRRDLADARSPLGELLLEMLLKLVDDARLFFRRELPSGYDISQSRAPFIHIGLR